MIYLYHRTPFVETFTAQSANRKVAIDWCIFGTHFSGRKSLHLAGWEISMAPQSNT